MQKKYALFVLFYLMHLTFSLEHNLNLDILFLHFQHYRYDVEYSLHFFSYWWNFISQVYGALSQLECGSEVWERILFQSFELLTDSNDEPLTATIDFIFKAASQCQHLPEAVSLIDSWELHHVTLFTQNSFWCTVNAKVFYTCIQLCFATSFNEFYISCNC